MSWVRSTCTHLYTHVHICTAVLCDGVDPWLLSEQSAEELLLPERVLWGGHRGDEGVVAGVRVAVRHQVGCCLRYLQIGDDLPQIRWDYAPLFGCRGGGAFMNRRSRSLERDVTHFVCLLFASCPGTCPHLLESGKWEETLKIHNISSKINLKR